MLDDYHVILKLEVALQIVLLCTLWLHSRRAHTSEHRCARIAAGFGAILLVAAVAIRCASLPDFFGPELSADEYAMSRSYVAYLLNGRGWISGATQIFHALLLILTYKLAGFSGLAARGLSLIMSLGGLALLYLAVRRHASRTVAIWSVALLASSTYAIQFSLLGLEVVSVMFYTPLILYLTSLILERPSVGKCTALGVITGVSVFTYPGQPIALVALGGAAVAIHLLRLSTGRDIYYDLRTTGIPRVPLFAAAIGCCVLVGCVGLLHFLYLANAKALLAGGGNFGTNRGGYLLGLTLYTYELFIETATFYLHFPETPFIDRLIVPFAIVGIAASWNVRDRHLLRLLAVAGLFAYLMAPFTGNLLGSRRLVFILIPASVAAAYGIEFLATRSRPWLLSVLLLGVVSAALYRKAADFRYSRSHILYDSGYCAVLVPDAALTSEALRAGEVNVSADEYTLGLDRIAMDSTLALARRFNLPQMRGSLKALRGTEVRELLARRDGGSLLSVDPRRSLTPVLAEPGACVYAQPIPTAARTIYRISSVDSAGSVSICAPADLEKLQLPAPAAPDKVCREGSSGSDPRSNDRD